MKRVVASYRFVALVAADELEHGGPAAEYLGASLATCGVMEWVMAALNGTGPVFDNCVAARKRAFEALDELGEVF